MKKKILSIILILVLLPTILVTILVTNIFPTVVYAGLELSYDEGDYAHYLPVATGRLEHEMGRDWSTQDLAVFNAIKTHFAPPANMTAPYYITVSGVKRYFNFRIWYTKQLICYGNYSMVNTRFDENTDGGNQDFWSKEDRQVDTQSIMGFYNRNGEVGEYRYHGYDLAGNKLSDGQFPPDSTVVGMNTYGWVYKPWSASYKKVKISAWNQAAEDSYMYNSDVQEEVLAWLNRPNGIIKPTDNGGDSILSFNNMYTIPKSKARDAAGIKGNGTGRPADYVHIASASTLSYPGEGKLFTNPASNQYRTVSIEKLTQKTGAVSITATPSATKTVVDMGSNNTTAYLNEKIPCVVSVTGILEDDTAFKDSTGVLQTVTYLRTDIKEKGWNLSLTGTPSLGLSAQNVQTAGNKGTTTFTVNKTRGEILNNRAGNTSTFQVNAVAKATFTNNESLSNDAVVTITYNISTVADNGEVTAHFVDEKNIKCHEDVVYEDLPLGKNTIPYMDLLPNYKHVDGEPTSKDVVLTSKAPKQEVTFNYVKIIPTPPPSPTKGSITVQYVYADGTEAKPSETPYSNVNMGTYVVCAAAVADSFVTGAKSYSVTLTTSNPNQTITFTYDKIPPLPKTVDPNVNIPPIAYDIVDFHPTDSTDMSTVKSKEVTIDGNLVDYNAFFSGTYIFGIGNDGLHKVVVRYVSVDDLPSTVERWVLVYNTKPRVQFDFAGSYRQNHKMTITNTSAVANDVPVISVYPITTYTWSFSTIDGTPDSWMTGTADDMYREMTYKKPGTYRITLQGTNTLGRVSDPYTLDFEILADIPAAIICNLDKISLARNETITAYYFDAVSTDGDSVAKRKVELWYDSNNDGTVDQLIQTWADVPNNTFPSYTPTKLGMYSFVITATEKIEGDIIPAHVTAADATVITRTREFWCDNYVPMTDIYVDTPIIRANADVFIMMDKNLASASVDYIKSGTMDFNNYLRTSNILAHVDNWDMHTYTYSQPASTTSNTGTTYPAATIAYSSSGYDGTLNRTSVSDNGSNHDFGGYVTTSSTDTKSVTGSQTTGTDKPPATMAYSDANGYFGTMNLISSADTGVPVTLSKTATAPGQSVSGHGISDVFPPATVSYSDTDGYSGTLYAYGYHYTAKDVPTGGFDWTRSYDGYSGTVTKTVNVVNWVGQYNGTASKTTSVTNWVADWRWVSNYTGSYSGTIYKNVRQPYVDPFNPTSDKYIIYVSDGNIAELTDLQNVVKQSGAKLILVTNSAAKTQITYNKYVGNTGVIDNDIQSALDYIAGLYALPTNTYTVLAGAPFTMNVSDYDPEGDAISSQAFQYVQNQSIYDNPMGLESFAVNQYSDTMGWVSTNVTSFSKTGEYTIYRRIQDKPSNDPNFAEYSYYSGTPLLKVDVVRKPIALATLDWDFDSTLGVYKTTWVDKSYSLEHQYNRPDKGILDRKIMFRQSGGDWQYTIPATLVPGTYELNYYVESVEGFWSDPFVMNFTLAAAPPMQFNASLKAEKPAFSPASIPASENLQLYNAWTRYPYGVDLQLALWNTTFTTQVVAAKTVNYSTATGTKTGNDINWNAINYNIPATLADGNYKLRVTAVGQFGQNQVIDFPVTVSTPINLSGYINNKLSNAEIYTDENNKFTFTTSIYATSVQLTFKGVTYTSAAGQIALISNDGTTKTWEMTKFIADGTMLDGETGTGVFKATLPTGISQTVNVNYTVIALQLKNLRITKIFDFSWKDLFVKTDGSQSPLQLNGIHVKDMPVYKNQRNKYIKLGYKVDFKIDSMGLNKAGDEITVKVKYLYMDDKLGFLPVDLFYKKPDDKYYRLNENENVNNINSFVLDEGKRFKYEPDQSKNTYNTWVFDFYLPPTIKVVRKGQELDLFNDNTLKNKLLVLFDITGKKHGSSTTFDYSSKETAWGTDTGSIYGRNFPTQDKILGKGLNSGEVFWYYLKETVFDDLEVNREW